MKIRHGQFASSSITIPYFLAEKIGKHIIKPLETSDGRLYRKIADYTVILYPFVHGESGKRLLFSKNQWIEFGKLLGAIHTVQLSRETADLPHETWNNKWRSQSKKYMQELHRITVRNRYDRQFINLLNVNRGIINEMQETAEELAEKIKNQKPAFSLCHGDIHAGNILMSADENEFYIVDWDTLMMAPKEKDLMFIGGGVANMWNRDEEETDFYKGYGDREAVDLPLLVYYRYERIIEDIVEYYDQFFADNIHEENQKAILERVGTAFIPGGVADMALKAAKKYKAINSA
ncbi:MAG: aminoglycoside phosphotransferase family protein [Treponema sp.]|nr:aminoglycoside phosphotransferase family protein [Treponema sp.]